MISILRDRLAGQIGLNAVGPRINKAIQTRPSTEIAQRGLICLQRFTLDESVPVSADVATGAFPAKAGPTILKSLAGVTPDTFIYHVKTNLPAIAAPTSCVDPFPPRSGVIGPSAITSSIAFNIPSWAAR